MFVLVLVIAALAGGGQTVGAATSAGTTLTLEKTSIDRTGMLYPEAWSVSEGSATWTPYFGNAAYKYAMPGSIPAAGTSMTLAVNVTATAPNRFAPALAIEGGVVQGGRVQVGALAEAGKSAAASKAVKLVPGIGGARVGGDGARRPAGRSAHHLHLSGRRGGVEAAEGGLLEVPPAERRWAARPRSTRYASSASSRTSSTTRRARRTRSGCRSRRALC